MQERLGRMGLSLLVTALIAPWVGPANVALADHPIVIHQAVPDVEAGTLTIRGEGFGTEPRVTLGDDRLTIASASRTEIVADLPVGLTAGTYRLKVSRRRGPSDVAHVVIGAAGPTGPPGPPGPPGPEGPPGPSRLTRLTLEVDCAAGERVADALAVAETHPGPVTIRVGGMCLEAVSLRRDDVELVGRGSAPPDGFEAPGAGAALIHLVDAHRISLRNLTLEGGGLTNGLSVREGSSVSASGLRIREARFGVLVNEGSRGRLSGSAVEGSLFNGVEVAGSLEVFSTRVVDSGGAGVRAEGQVTVNDCVLSGNQYGLWAYKGGQADLDETEVVGNRSNGLVSELGSTILMIRGRLSDNAGRAALAYLSSRIQLDAVPVEDNDSGIHVVEGSLLRMAGSPGSMVTVRNHPGNGITLRDSSVVSANGFEISGNAGWGVFCEDVPSAAQVSGTFSAATVFGNTAGQVSCPGLSIP